MDKPFSIIRDPIAFFSMVIFILYSTFNEVVTSSHRDHADRGTMIQKNSMTQSLFVFYYFVTVQRLMLQVSYKHRMRVYPGKATILLCHAAIVLHEQA